MSEVLTPEEVAEYLRLDTEAVYRLIHSQELAARWVGRSYGIPRKDFDDFLHANNTRPEVQAALMARVNEIAERNPGVDGDALLEELEREDDERKRQRVS